MVCGEEVCISSEVIVSLMASPFATPTGTGHTAQRVARLTVSRAS